MVNSTIFVGSRRIGLLLLFKISIFLDELGCELGGFTFRGILKMLFMR